MLAINELLAHPSQRVTRVEASDQNMLMGVIELWMSSVGYKSVEDAQQIVRYMPAQGMSEHLSCPDRTPIIRIDSSSVDRPIDHLLIYQGFSLFDELMERLRDSDSWRTMCLHADTIRDGEFLVDHYQHTRHIIT